jgi:hypothetical protein
VKSERNEGGRKEQEKWKENGKSIPKEKNKDDKETYVGTKCRHLDKRSEKVLLGKVEGGYRLLLESRDFSWWQCTDVMLKR